MAKIALIDGYGFIFRAFYALPGLTTSKGEPTNAVYGFVRMVLAVVNDLKADYIAVVFDSKSETFRKSLYADYKSNRKETPPELISQINLVKDAIAALNLVCLEQPGYEADDLIATYTRLARDADLEVVIVSSDKDLMQLVTLPEELPKVELYDSVKKKYIRSQEVVSKFGVSPSCVPDVQALMGDSSDNVPGVKGLGPKTATSLIQQFGSLRNLYDNLDDVPKKAVKEKLIDNQEMAFLSLQLVTLKNDVALPESLESLRLRPLNPYQLYNFCLKLEFFRLAKDIETKYALSLDSPEVNQDPENVLPEVEKYTLKVITHPSDLIDLSVKLKQAFRVFIACEDNMFHIITDKDLDSYLIIVNEQSDDGGGVFGLLDNDIKPYSSITPDHLMQYIVPILADTSIAKIGYDIKSLYHTVRRFCPSAKLESFEDIKLMSYALDGPSVATSVDNIARNSLGYSLDHCKRCFTTDFAVVEEHFIHLYCGNLVALRLYDVLRRRLVFEKVKYVYETIDKPLVDVLFHMENKGVLISPQVLLDLNQEIIDKQQVLEKEIYSISGEEFNLASPRQVGEVLYEKLNIKGKKLRSGSWKTDANSLEDLANNGVEIADKILSWRQFAKLKNTYIDSLPTFISPVDNRLHTTFLQTSTNTGRMSSLDPNLQNIPIKTDFGKRIRRAFIAPKGYKILSLDYSQIELRLLAHIGKVEPLIEAFKQNLDIHSATAKEVFNLKDEDCTVEHRRKAKIINFGIIYGISEFGLARRLLISRETAKAYIDLYFERYPQILQYMEDAKAEARKYGYVLTEFGRKCFIQNINSSNGALRSFAERAAINAKLQGTAADILRKCLSECYSRVCKSSVDAYLTLQIHDELVFEVKEEIAEEVAKAMVDVMTKICELQVPLTVNYAIGDNWLDAH